MPDPIFYPFNNNKQPHNPFIKRTFTEQELLDAEERFWRKVDFMTTPDGCWLWTGAKMNEGYGRLIMRTGVHILVHRMSWMLYHGLITRHEVVCHACDTPLCVRPEHLFLGDAIINNADRHAKGRSKGPKGEANANCKLTPEQVKEIRRLYVPYKVSTPKLGKQFGVHSSTISAIINGETWV